MSSYACTVQCHENFLSCCSFLFSEDGKNYGTLTVAAEELSKGRQESVYFVCSATKLDRKDLFGKCDPFLKISRINKDNTFVKIYFTYFHKITYSKQNFENEL